MKNVFSFTLEFNYTVLTFIFLDNQLFFIFNYERSQSDSTLLKVYVFHRTTTLLKFYREKNDKYIRYHSFCDIYRH
jgi:hypothetical protein